MERITLRPISEVTAGQIWRERDGSHYRVTGLTAGVVFIQRCSSEGHVQDRRQNSTVLLEGLCEGWRLIRQPMGAFSGRPGALLRSARG